MVDLRKSLIFLFYNKKNMTKNAKVRLPSTPENGEKRDPNKIHVFVNSQMSLHVPPVSLSLLTEQAVLRRPHACC